jgi:hypothetical protein
MITAALRLLDFHHGATILACIEKSHSVVKREVP